MRDLNTVFCCLHSRYQPRYPRFKLCPECRAEAPREAMVVETVVDHFSKPEFREFFIETEHEIQMGVDKRRPDIVFLDKVGNFVAIVECKQKGVIAYGRDQLQAYLCATDTPFGVFANSTEPADWEFYENLGRNQFREITREQFETEVPVYSVSDLTSTLSRIIRKNSTLQNIWMNGKVSKKTQSKGNLPCFFMIENEGNEIECVIDKEKDGLFAALPAVGNDVLVNGNVVLWPSKGEYRFTVAGIKNPSAVLKGKIVSVTDLIDTLQTIVKIHSGKVQGKISNKPTKRRGYIHLHLKDADANEDTVGATIECQLPPSIADNLSFSVKKGDIVRIDGQFDIFPPVSRYQIIARNIQYAPYTDSSEDEDKMETVVEDITTRDQLSDEIKILEPQLKQLEDKINDLKVEKDEVAQQVRQESEKLDEVKQTIKSDRAHNQDLKSIQKHLSDAIERLRMDKTKLETEVGKLERKEHELYASRKQRKEKIQQLETLLNDLKSDLSKPLSEDNIGPQKSRGNKKQGIKSWFKNRFSKENK